MRGPLSCEDEAPASELPPHRMADPSLHQETIDFSLSTVGSRGGPLVGLTLLYHPNPERVGQVVPLFSLGVGGTRKLCRLEPDFARHGEDARHSLASPVLSRTPIVIRAADLDTISIENPAGLSGVTVQGQPLDGKLLLPASALAHGVVLGLSGCVLLLMHWLTAERDPDPDFGILGESLEIRRVREEVRRIADLEASVLIRGESGSGKELVARAIHTQSRRSSGAYISVNMGAIPPSVAASMLFGHAKGAFTGAQAASPGFFGSADGGTLFLDEVGETPREIQPLLLRAIREGEVQPVGEPRARKVDVRVLSATDANLDAMVERGQFGMPLLRRLEGYTIQVPALRQRRDDLARLFFRFLRRELDEMGEGHKLAEPQPSQKPWLPALLVASLLEYRWPGNVAELQTIAKRIAITNRDRPLFYLDPMIAARLAAPESKGVEADAEDRRAADVDTAARNALPRLPSERAARQRASAAPALARKGAASLEDEDIARAMREHGFKIKVVAEVLGVSRSWLNTRLESCQGIRKAKELGREEILNAASATNGALPAMAEQLEVSEHGLKLRMKALDISGL
jgi:two-component system, NtrC family, nitrogen regulation response regulator GlnG